jgi:hypothetical protein
MPRVQVVPLTSATAFVHVQVVPVFNFRRVDLLMRQWDVKQGRLEAALFKYRQTGQRPLANARGCLGGPKVTPQPSRWLHGLM